MRRHLWSSLLILAVWGMAVAAGWAQTSSSSTQSQDPLDNAGGGARAVGMGRAFAGVADDSTALLWNPAGLAQLGSTQLSINHGSWLVSAFQEILTAGLPAGNLGGFGLAANYAGYGSMDGRDALGFSTGSYGASQFGLGVGWGKQVLGDWAVGLSLQAESQNLDTTSSLLLGANGGILLRTSSGWGAGLSFENLGVGSAGSSLASSERLGFSKLWKDRAGTSFLAALSGTLEPNGVSSVQGGAEFTYRSSLSARAGYDFSLDQNQISGLQGLTLGAGVVWNSFQLDYAFEPYGELGATHMVSLGYLFQGKAPKAAGTTAKALSPAAVAAPAQPPAAAPSQVLPQVVPQQVAGSTQDKKTITMEFEVPAGGAVSQALSLEASGQMVQAANLLRDDLKANPNDTGAWRELGNVFFKLGHKTSAIYCFQVYLKQHPDQALSDWLTRYQGQP